MQEGDTKQEPVRVLMVCTIMDRGGTEALLMNYYRHIDRNRVQFDFLVHREKIGVYEAEISAMGGKVWRLPALTLTSVVQYRSAIDQFFSEHQDYQIVHIHSAGVALFVAAAARKHKIPVIIQHSHCCGLNKWDWTSPFRYVCKILTRPLLTHYFACGRGAAVDLFGSRAAQKAIILPNAISLSDYRYSTARYEQIRKKEHWDGRFVIGNVARFSRVKNHPRQLGILEAVLKKRPNALLVCVGDKQNDYEMIQSLAEQKGLLDHVCFTGGRNDVSDLLQGFDVFLFPSFFEGLSVAMIEAQAAGLHVVASDSIARESAIVSDGVDFISLNASNEIWADALLTPYKRRDTYEDICRAGYDIEENAQWLQQFYLDQEQTTK